MDKNQIKILIAEGKTESALDEIINNIQYIKNGDSKNDFIVQMSRFKRIMRDKRLGIDSSENINVSLNQITVSVLDMLDDIEFQFNGSGKGPDPSDRKSRYRINEMNFDVIYSDITEVDSEVVVSSDDSHLTMSGGVSKAIRLKAGTQLVEETKKHIPVKLGGVAVTSAGQMNAKYIFHGITIDKDSGTHANEQVVASIVNNALRLADSLGIKKITFPALATGSANFAFEKAAKTMTHSISDYLQKEDTQIESVVLCLYSREGKPTSDLKIFYEQAVGLASIRAQSNKLDALLGEFKDVLSKRGMNDLVTEVDDLKERILESSVEIASHEQDNDIFTDSDQSLVQELSSKVNRFSLVAPTNLENEQQELIFTKTKLQGLYTILNIKQSQLNGYQIKKAKYVGQTVPEELTRAIADLIIEMEDIQNQVKEIKKMQLQLIE